MKSLWARHKGFGIPVTVGTVILMAWYLMAYRSIRAETDAARTKHDGLQRQARAQAQEGVAAADALAELQGDLDRRVGDLTTMAARCQFLRHEWAQKAIDTGDASMQFTTQILVLRDQFQRKGLTPKGAAVLGFTSTDKPQAAVAVEYLDRLSAIVAVLEAMDASGVRSVQRIDPFTAHFSNDTAATISGLFVNGVKITVTFQAPSQAVFATVHRLQAPPSGKPYLPLLSLKADQDDPGKDLLTATIEVAVLHTDMAGSLTPTAEGPPP